MRTGHEPEETLQTNGQVHAGLGEGEYWFGCELLKFCQATLFELVVVKHAFCVAELADCEHSGPAWQVSSAADILDGPYKFCRIPSCFGAQFDSVHFI